MVVFPVLLTNFLVFVDGGVVFCLGLIGNSIFFFALSFLVFVAQGWFVGSANTLRNISIALLTIRSFIILLYFFAVCNAFVVGL